MSSFDIFSHHYKDISFDSRCQPGHLLPTVYLLVGQDLERIATFESDFCVKTQSLHYSFDISGRGVKSPVWELTSSTLNHTGEVSDSLFNQSRISIPHFPCNPNQIKVNQWIAKNIHKLFKQIVQSPDQGISSTRFNLCQTSFLSHLLPNWYTVVSMLHFLLLRCMRLTCRHAQKMQFLGVFARRTPPAFVLFRIKVRGVSFRFSLPYRFVQNSSLNQCELLIP